MDFPLIFNMTGTVRNAIKSPFDVSFDIMVMFLFFSWLIGPDGFEVIIRWLLLELDGVNSEATLHCP